MTRVAERVLLDTNVLLAATDEGRGGHSRALATLNDWPATGVALYTSGQVLREYLCVATREVAHNGLGMKVPAAITNVRALRSRLRLLDETVKVADRFLKLLASTPCRGKQMHDANVVATMLTHGIGTLVTFNPSDFERFSAHIEVVGP